MHPNDNDMMSERPEGHDLLGIIGVNLLCQDAQRCLTLIHSYLTLGACFVAPYQLNTSLNAEK